MAFVRQAYVAVCACALPAHPPDNLDSIASEIVAATALVGGRTEEAEQSRMSKGSNRRPQEVDEQTMAENWARAFGTAPTRFDEAQEGGVMVLKTRCANPTGKSVDGNP